MILDSVLSCPECGHQTKETMIENTCQYSYRCPACEKVIKTSEGECCIYCSYGDYPCPKTQITGSACCGID